MEISLNCDTKYLWEILVPCNWNDGRPVRTRHHKEWDKIVRKISAGLTILKPARGQWLSQNNELFEDRMIPVRFISTEKEAKYIANKTIEHYKQLAVLYYKISSECVIHNANEEQLRKIDEWSEKQHRQKII